MKRILVLCVIGMTSLGFSYDRFHSDIDRTEEIFTEFNDHLVKVCEEIKILNEKQVQMLDMLQSICAIADQHSIDEWIDQPTFSEENE